MPTLIHEQNAVMGRANKALAARVDAIAGGFLNPDDSGASAKIVVTGNPVRPAVLEAAKIAISAVAGRRAVQAAGVRRQPGRAVLFRRGAGGDRAAARRASAAPGGHAAGAGRRRRRASRPPIAALGVDAEVSPFFTDMAARMAAAHLVISRSGASTVSEIAVIGRPALLVPYPHALDHDQAANAAALAAAGGAEVHPQPTLSPERLAELLGGLMGDPRRLAAMAAARQVGRQARCRAVARRPDRGYCVGKDCFRIQGGDPAMKMPQTIGLVHFIGIGGIGMSGIAEVLHNLGYRVQGSDQADSANVQRLRDKGIECFVGHKAENLGDAEVVVVSTAIKKANPELKAAREKTAADRQPRRDAGRTDALPPGDRHRRHAWQDHDDLAGRRRCSKPAGSTRPWSMAASSTPTAPMRAWARANGWWSRPTRATAPS